MKKAGIRSITAISLILVSLLFLSCQSHKTNLRKFISWDQPQKRGFKAFDRQAKELLKKMTLEEKIGQMTQPEQDLHWPERKQVRY